MAWGLITSTSAGSANGNTVTTAGVNSTNATLIVLALAADDGTQSVSDSAGNTWTLLGRASALPGIAPGIALYFVTDPVTNAAHTFSATATGLFPAIAVEIWSGTTSRPAWTGDVAGASAPSSGSVSVGNITPVDTGCLIVAAMACVTLNANATLSDGFTDRQQTGSGANNYNVSLGDKIQTNPVAVRMGWSHVNPTATAASAILAAFSLVAGTTSDDWNTPRADANTNARSFLQRWYRVANHDIAPLRQRWDRDTAATTPAGATSDISSRQVLLVRATQGLTS